MASRQYSAALRTAASRAVLRHYKTIIMKKTIVFIGLMIMFLDLASQNCYIQKEEASGINVQVNQILLNQEACNLIGVFPESFQDDFKVYGAGFYLHLSSIEETIGINQVYGNIKNEVQNESDYYLLIAKQSTSQGIYTNFFVDLKLPETDEFECLTETFRLLITEKVRKIIDDTFESLDRSPNQYHIAEIAGMNELERIISNINDGMCCDFQADEILEVLQGMDFVGYPCYITDQPPTLRPNDNDDSANRSQITITDFAELDFEIYGNQISSYQALFELLSNLSGQGYNGNGFITKNENFCDNNKFDQVKDDYYLNTDDFDVWYHIWENPNEEEEDIVFVKSEKFNDILSLVNVTSLPTNDGNFEWLDKATLSNYVQNNYCIGCSSGQLENVIGQRFENVWHQYAASNFNIFGWNYRPFPQNVTVPGIRNTIPDGWSNSICGRGTTPTVYPDARWYEVKAKNGNIYNSTSSGQIRSHIVAMGLSATIQPARRANCAILSIITTSNCNVAASVYREGTRNRIQVNHWYAQYFIDSLGRMKVQFKLYLPCFFGLTEAHLPTLTINPAIL